MAFNPNGPGGNIVVRPINRQNEEGNLLVDQLLARKAVRAAQLKANDSGLELDGPKLATMGPMGVDVEEGYKERWRDDEQTAVRIMDVPWSGRHAWLDLMLGYTVIKSAPDRLDYMSRELPAQHPEYPWMWAMEAELIRGIGFAYDNPVPVAEGGLIAPVPETASMISYGSNEGAAPPTDGLARFAITYRSVDFELKTDDQVQKLGGSELQRYVSRKVTPALKALDLPADIKGNVYFQNADGTKSNTKINQGAVIMLPILHLEYTWHRVVDPPFTKITQKLGTVNKGPFDNIPGGWGRGGIDAFLSITGQGFEDETLLFQAPVMHRYVGTTGRVEWRITFKFDWNPVGWNTFLNAEGNYQRAGLFDAAGNLLRGVYKTSEFMPIFSGTGLGIGR